MGEHIVYLKLCEKHFRALCEEHGEIPRLPIGWPESICAQCDADAVLLVRVALYTQVVIPAADLTFDDSDPEC